MKFVRIAFEMVNPCCVCLSFRSLSEHKGLLLTMILELWRLFVAIIVSIGRDDGVSLLEMIWTFFADSIGLLRKGSDACSGVFIFYFVGEFKNALVLHVLVNKIKCLSIYTSMRLL